MLSDSLASRFFSFLMLVLAAGCTSGPHGDASDVEQVRASSYGDAEVGSSPAQSDSGIVATLSEEEEDRFLQSLEAKNRLTRELTSLDRISRERRQALDIVVGGLRQNYGVDDDQSLKLKVAELGLVRGDAANAELVHRFDTREDMELFAKRLAFRNGLYQQLGSVSSLRSAKQSSLAEINRRLSEEFGILDSKNYIYDAPTRTIRVAIPGAVSADDETPTASSPPVSGGNEKLILTLSREEADDFIQLVRSRDQADEDRKVLISSLLEARSLLEEVRSVLEGRFNISDDPSLKLDAANLRVFSEENGAEKTVFSFEDQTELGRCIDLINSRDELGREAAAVSGIIQEKELELARVRSLLSTKYTLTEDRNYRYDPATRDLFVIENNRDVTANQ